MFSPVNAARFHPINRATSRVIAPPLADLLQAGIDKGVFRINDARGVAEMILHLEGSLHTLLSQVAHENGETTQFAGREMSRRVAQIGIVIDRMLSLADHTIVFGDPTANAADSFEL